LAQVLSSDCRAKAMAGRDPPRERPGRDSLALPADWKEVLVTKNTFLDWPSESAQAHREAELSRPSSDPSSNSSSRSNSSSLSSGRGALATTNGRAAHQRIEVIESLASRLRQTHVSPAGMDVGSACSSAVAVAGPGAGPQAGSVTINAALLTPGAAGHETISCTPCAAFTAGLCVDGAQCMNCHLPHKKKSTRKRPPPNKRDMSKQMVMDLLSKAMAEGDAFCLDTAPFVPKYVKTSRSLREKFLATLACYRESRPSGSDPHADIDPSSVTDAQQRAAFCLQARNEAVSRPEPAHSDCEVFSI